jgi:hypothetical protein
MALEQSLNDWVRFDVGATAIHCRFFSSARQGTNGVPL